MPIGDDERARARRHHELERRLADRLRSSDKAQRQSLYGEVYDELYSGLERLGLLSRVAQNGTAQVGILCDLLSPFLARAASFAEFGAGDGALSERIAADYPNLESVIAVDASSNPGGSPARASSVLTVAPDQIHTAIRPSSIDVGFSCHFVEHLHPEDLHDHLVEVRRKLRAGGCYIVTTPNILLGPHDVSRDFDAVATGLHLQEYSYRSLADSLRQAGFERIEAIHGVAAPFRIIPIHWMLAGEAAVRRLPKATREFVLRATGRPRPFRALEQVKLVAWK